MTMPRMEMASLNEAIQADVELTAKTLELSAAGTDNETIAKALFHFLITSVAFNHSRTIYEERPCEFNLSCTHSP